MTLLTVVLVVSIIIFLISLLNPFHWQPTRASQIGRVALIVLIVTMVVAASNQAVRAQSGPVLELTKDFGGATSLTVESGEIFTYNISYRCASITQNCANAVVTDTLPAGIEYINAIGPVSDVENISYDSGSNTVTFEFFNPLSAGTTGLLTIDVRFAPGTLPGTTAVNSADSISNDLPFTSNEAIATATGAFEMTASKSHVGDFDDGVIGDQFTTNYRVQVCSPDLLGGVRLTNPTLLDQLPLEATFISASHGGVYISATHTISWTYASLGGGLPDIIDVANGCGLTVSANVRFEIDGRDTIPGSGDEPIANDVVTNGFTLQGEPEDGSAAVTLTGTDDLTLRDPYFDDSAGKTSSSASTYIFGTEELAGGFVTYNLTYENTGTITTTQVLVTDTVPANVEVMSVRIGPMIEPAEGYYQSNDNPGVWVAFPQNPYASTQNVTVTETGLGDGSDIELAPGDYITALNWRLGEIPPSSGTWNGGGFTGMVDPALLAGVLFNNCADTTAFWDDSGSPIPVNHNECASLRVIDERAIPLVSKSASDPSLRPNEVSEITLTFSNHPVAHNPVLAPINLADVMPADFELVLPDATEQTGYRTPTALELSAGSWYSFTTTDTAPPPTHTITTDFDGNGRTLLQWDWDTPYAQDPGETVTISFYVRIKEFSGPKDIDNLALLLWDPSTENPVACTGASQYIDIYDLDGDSDTTETGCQSTLGMSVETYLALDSQKFVWGELDSGWVNYGETVHGGRVDYRILITNTGNVPATNIVVYDIFPFIGDTGVVDTSSRESAWRPNLQAPISNTLGLPLTIYYSQSGNPCRTDVSPNGPAGCVDDWSTTPPADITSVQAVRLDFCNETTCVELAPDDGAGGGALEFYWHMVAPEVAPIFVDDEVAWNSFGFVAEGGGLTLLPSEPIRVGIQISPDTTPGYSIGDYVFLDVYGQQDDGIQQPEELGVNGVRVELWNATTNTLVDYRVTGPDHISRDGYYLFVNIPPEDYYLRFFPPASYSVSPANQGSDDALDSDGQTTGTDATFGDYYQTATFTMVDADDMSWDQGVWQDVDYGDAPATYPTEAATQSNPADAARHLIVDGIQLGTAIDAETDGQPASNAFGDDNNGDDEDGVTFIYYNGTTALPTALMNIGETTSVTISATVPTTQTGYLNAWVDFNADGDWDDAGEQIATDQVVTTGNTNLNITVPVTATGGTTYARFRLSTEAGLTPRGTAVDGEVEDYRIQFLSPPAKSIVSTSEAHTSGSNVAIGEIVRYQLSISLPEGISPNFVITDTLPAGLQYLGNPTYNFTANSTVTWTQSTVNAGPFLSGTDPVFTMGTVTNNDTDSGEEFLLVEFNALVLNESGNNAGDVRNNRFTVTYDTFADTSPDVAVTLVEPLTTIAKTITTSANDAGDTVVYQLVASNSSATNIESAFDLLITDTLDSSLALQSISVTKPGYATVTDTTNIPSNQINVLLDQLDPGDSVTIAITATVVTTATVGETIPNVGYITYSSLPGEGSTGNPTTSDTPGASGDTDGERNGDGGVNDHADNDNIDLTLDVPTIDKQVTPTSYTIGDTLTYDILVTLPEGIAEDLVLVDDLPTGLSYQSHQIITTTAASNSLLTADFNGTLPTPSVTALGGSGVDATLNFGDTTTVADNVTTNNQFQVRITAVVLDILGNQNGDSLTNTATLNYTRNGSTTSLDDSVNITLVEPVLAISKQLVTPVPDPLDAGTVITYQIVLDHAASSAADAFDVVITDTLPATLTAISVDSVTASGLAGPTSDLTGNSIRVPASGSFDFPEGAVVTVTVSATIAGTAVPGQIIANTAGATWSTLDGTPDEERDGGGDPDGNELLDGGDLDDYEVASTENLTVDGTTTVKSLVATSAGHTTGSNVTIGEIITYSLTITVPEGTIPSLTVVDNLPLGLAYVAGTAVVDDTGFSGTLPTLSLTAPGNSGDDVTFSYSSFTVPADNNPNNNSFSLELQAVVLDVPGNDGVNPGQTTLTNNATVQIGSGTPETVTPVDVTVVEPQMEVVKSFNTNEAAPNETVTVTLTVNNNGNSTAFEVIIDDPIVNDEFHTITEGTTQTGFTFSTVPSGGDTIVRYTGGNIAAGASATFTFEVTLDADLLPSPPDLTNIATVTQATTLDSTVDDGDDGEERDEPDVDGNDDLTVIIPDIVLTKTDGQTVIDPGEQITYTLTIENVGTAVATGVTITETVPANTTFVGTAGWTCLPDASAGSTCTYDLGTLNDGASTTAEFSVIFDATRPPVANSVVNTAVAHDDNTHGNDPTPDNNDDTDTDAVSASIGDFVWEDMNGNGQQDDGATGIQGVTVTLYDSGNNVISTTTTLADGSYQFLNLDLGDYYLEFTPPAGYEITQQNQGADTTDSDIDPATGRTATTNLVAAEHDPTWDAGLYQPASIGDFVWYDLNNDGIQDGGNEVGLYNITVNLYDSGDSFITSTTTLGDGSYSFTDLPPGGYYIEVVTPTNYTISPQNQTGDTADSDIDITTGQTDPTTLISGEDDTTWDGGLYALPASIGNYVWLDADENGRQDTDEFGVPGVTVNLYDDGDNLRGTTTTDDFGLYSFTNLPPGDYYVEVEPPTGYTITGQDLVGDTLDSDINATTGQTIVTTLDPDENDPTWDAGLYIDPATIGDYIWLDANQDGIQDSDEYGIGDVTVELYDGNNNLLDTTTTDDIGGYSFTNLPPGNYYVEVLPPTDYIIVAQDAGSDDTADSDINVATGQTIPTTLASNENDDSWDGGLYIDPATIGDYIWLDANQDGIQDGDEFGIPGVTVNLYNSSDTFIGTTTTAFDGSYNFTNLPPSDYYVDVVPPTGYTIVLRNQGSDDALDSDIDTTTGETAVTTLISNENDPTWDGGLYIDPASLGDFVWLDADQNGIQDSDEYGINGVIVELYDANDNLIDTTTTDGYGGYSFTNLPPSDYYISVTPPTGYIIVTQNAGSDDAVDSDINGTGQTTPTTLISNENDVSWDAGLYIDPVAIGNYIFLDVYGQQDDGIQQPEELGVNGVRVELWNATTNTLVDYRITGPDHIFRDGYYLFVNIPPEDYFLRFFPPASYSISPANQGSDDALDSDGQTTGTDATFGDYYQTATFTMVDADDMSWDQGVWQDVDYGDAPATYPTEAATQSNPADAARHLIVDGIQLGTAIDAETDGQPASNAFGDDNNGDDEDGVTFIYYNGTTALPTALMNIGETTSVTISATVPTTQTGYLNAWVDFNADGDWDDAGEQIATDQVVTTGNTNLNITVPVTATGGTTYARFRLSTEAGLTPRGTAVDGEVEDYRIQFLSPPAKSIVSTSEAHTSGSNVAIGEIVRYQLSISLPEGISPNFVITDTLPAGLQYLGNPTYNFTANSTVTWTQSTVNAGPFLSGTDPVFTMGTVTNNDTDSGEEFLLVEFNALVLNESGNNAGDVRNNRFTVTYDTFADTSPDVAVTLVEPLTTIAKTITTSANDAGDTVVYQLVASNSSATNIESAFDLLITDTLDSSLALQSISVTKPGYATVTDTTNIPSNQINVLLDQLDPGDSVTIAITATVVTTATVGETIPNVGYITYSSLPGEGSTGNPTTSDTPGASGDTDGERNGDGGVNDHADNDNIDLTLDVPTIDKQVTPTSYTIGDTLTYDILVTLPEGIAEDLVLVDDLPTGLSYQSHQIITTTAASNSLLTADFNGTLPTPSVTALGGSGVDATLNFGDTTTVADNVTTNNQFQVRITAVVLNILGNQNGDSLTNTATLNYTRNGSTTSLDDSVNITLVEPVLAISKQLVTPVPDPLDAGTVITYQIVLDHAASSAADAFDVVITDTLPATLTTISVDGVNASGLTAPTADLTGNSIRVPATGSFDFPQGSVVTVTVSATIAGTAVPGQTIANTAGATWSTLDGTPSEERDGGGDPDGNELLDGGDLDDYEVEDTANLTVDGTASVKTLVDTSAGHTSGSNVTIGEVITYSISISVAEGTIPSLEIIDNLPVGLEYVPGTAVTNTTGFNGTLPTPTITAPGGSGGDVTFTFGSFIVPADNDPNNNSFLVQLQATVLNVPGNDGVNPGQTTLTNNASVQIGSGTPETVTPVDVTVVEPQMEIVKSFSTNEASPNDTITVTLTVSNTGTSTAYDIIIDDPIANDEFHTITEGTTPTGFTFSTVPSGSDTIVRYTGGNIAAGASATFTFEMTLDPDLLPSPPDLSNTATVTQATTLDSTVDDGDDGEERDEPDVDDTDTLTVIVPDIVLTKTDGIILVDPGEQITYTLTITNAGTAVATGVVITETVPANTTFAGTTGWTCLPDASAGSTCTYALGTLNDGASTTVDFSVIFDATRPPVANSVVNTAVAHDDNTHGNDPTPDNNDDTDTDAVSASIGDFVWEDINGNGQQDDGATGIENVTVTLYDSGDNIISTTTTLADGSYQFLNLDLGDYYLEFMPPAGYEITQQNLGADSTDSDIDPITGQTISTTLISGEHDASWDAGLYQPASIGDFVWYDLNNDGIQDGGNEVGLYNITVNLYDGSSNFITTTTTLGDGSYSFTDLPPGDYYIEVVAPTGYSSSPQDQGADNTLDSDLDSSGQTDVTSLISAENDTTWDGGLYAPPATIGDYIWLDADENGIQDTDEFGIPGVTINLYDDGDNLRGTTPTDDFGLYNFTNLPPGDYYIFVTPPTGYTIVPQNQGSDDALDSDIDTTTGETAVTTLTSNENDPTWDGGLYIDPATIGDYVWLDANQDGIQDSDEYGIGGVTVELYDGNDNLISTTTTDGNGGYAFTNLVPGDYYVVVTPLSGYTIVTQDAGSDDAADSDIDGTGQTITTTLTANENDPSWDGGLYIDPATIGDYIWLDADQDGIQDADEYGIGNVTVTLYDSGDTLIGITTTLGDGSYAFTNLPPGDYYVVVAPPTGYTIVTQDAGSDDTADSDINGTGQTTTTTLTSGEDDPSWDGGLYIIPASLGDLVWLDANQDGLQDIGEYGVPGVTVNLYDSSDTFIATTTTDYDGSYSFTNLAPADYHIEVIPPTGYTVTDQDQGDDTLDSDVNTTTGLSPNTTLTSGENDTTWDAGLHIDPASIGNYVWLDANQDGIQDSDELGIRDVTVELYDGNGNLLDTTTTDGNGGYTFTNLPPGDYYADVTPPTGYTIVTQDAGSDDTADSDINGTGQTATTTLISGEDDPTWDGGLYTNPASLGDYIWLDANQDGIQDSDEFGIPGVAVNLYDSGDTFIGTTTSAFDGSYGFSNLPPGDYYVEVMPLSGYTIVPQDVGSDDTADSDINAATGQTATTTLISNENDPTWDAGLYIDPASIGNYVWLDANQDGIQDSDELGIRDVTVDLYDGNSNLISTTTTDGNGGYSFTNLPPGNYYVAVTPPTGYTIVPQNQGSDDALDSDIDETTGETAVTILTANENDPSWDGGLYIDPATIGDYIWLDANQDGIQDSDEFGIPGVTVNLYDSGDTFIGTTTTAFDGSYSFTNLPPDDYYIVVTPPTGYNITDQDQGSDDGLDSDIDVAMGETAVTTLISNENDPNWDSGLYIDPATIGDFVWLDANQDGIQDSDEYGISDVTVELYDASGNLIDSTTTDSNGGYSFTNLVPGDYYVVVTPLSGYTIVPQDVGSDDTVDSDINAATGQTATTTLVSNENDPTWDAGLYIDPASIGNYVWLDANQDGIQDSDELGIRNVTVSLFDSNDNLISTTTTDGNGGYSFTDLPPGDYYVAVTPPTGYTIVPQNQGSDDGLDSDIDATTGETAVTTLTANENDPTWDGGLYASPASLGDYIWLDANQDGVQDSDEFGIPGVTVNLYDSGDTFIGTTTTAFDGSYDFSNLPPGNYYVEVVPPTSYTITLQDQTGDTADSDIDPATGQTIATTLTAGENDPTWDGGLYVIPASLGDYVWLDANQDGLQDSNEFGVSNVTVNLYDASDNLLDTTTTDAYGGYSFSNLPPADYYVEVVPPTGYTITGQDAGDDALDSDIDSTTGQTISTTLTSGENDPTWDAGLHIDPASIGNFVWLDANQDGIQDSGELGIGNVTVALYDGNDNLIDTTTTLGDGSYGFSNLPPGDYYVVVTPPTGYSITLQDQTGDSADSDIDPTTGQTSTTTLVSGEDDTTWDGGLYTLPASLGDYVWLDANQDGLQDIDEFGVPGVTVNLYDSNSTFIATTTTAYDGSYSFTNLAPGDYHIEVVPPVSYTITGQDAGNDALDSDVDTTTGLSIDTNLTSGENDTTWDAGLHISPASMGDYVWLDANQNGIQDSDELGIRNVTVSLFDSNDNLISTTTTDGNGGYSFTDLPPGDYYVAVTPPTGYTIVPQNQGSDDALDSDIDTTTGETAVTILTANENDPNWDGGLYASPASLGDYIWLDANQDGIQDSDEFGIPGVTVNLYDSGDTFIGTTTTAFDGSYGFSNLPPGDYYVEVVPPASYTITLQDQTGDSADSDIDPTTGQTIATTLTAGENDPTWDGGLYIIPASLGDYVWLDANQDGLQDSDEFGVPNVTVNLYDVSDNLLDTTTTDAYGGYSFSNLPPADYYVEVIPPTGYTITSQDAGDDALDSDINPTPGLTFGQTISTTLTSGENDPTWDAGLHISPASLGDYVWLDANLNGTQDFNEGGVIAVVVSLYDGSGNLLDSTATNATGFYEFTNLPPGGYYVQVMLPNGYAFTTQDLSGNDATDSDVDATTGETIVTTLVAGDNDPTWDSGLVPAIARLGDYVWEDLNGDGIQDVGEPGVLGVEVQLYDISNTQIMTTTTDANGRYQFIDLTPGTYHVEFVLPTGYDFTTQDQGGSDAADSDADTTSGATIPTILTPGENDMSWDAGLIQPLNPTLASIGNYVWEDLDGDGLQDSGEPGVENVTVNLYDSNNVLTDTITTDANGLYQFIDLTPGDYHVEFILPAGYDFTLQDQLANDAIDSDADTTTGLTIVTTLVAGENDISWDAGLVQSLNPALAAIGNYVWLDANEDGLQNIGEPGLENVTVNLYDSNDVLTGTTTTDANGLYQFIDLPPGDYYVEFVPLTGYILTGQDLGSDDTLDSDADADIFSATFGQTIPTTLVAGENDTTWDAGLFVPSAPSTASLGDYVWLDANVDGVQDGSESGVENVTVNLYTSADVLVDTTTTDAAGFYEFTNLLPGDYYVEFVPPTGYALTFDNSGVTDLDDSDADPVTGQTAVTTLTAGENDPTWDAGLYQTLRLGNRVWFDVNNNGRLDAGEQPVPGILMELLDGVGNPYILPATGLPLTTTTDVDGIYQFENLPSGDYIVRVAEENFDEWTDPLYGFVSSRNNAVTDPAVDPDNNSSNVDDNGRNNPDPANGGIVSYPVTLTVGGEPTNEGTEEDGSYPNADSNLTVDFGFFELLTLGNYIWFDSNENSIIDGNEPGVNGVVVYLLDANGNSVLHPVTNQPISTTTNQSGFYQFTNLYPGEYRILVGTENFYPGGALEAYWSSPGAVDPDDNSDIDDNGLDEVEPWNTGIMSEAVRLDYDMEPRNNDDSDDNDNTNLTVDMGFVATPTAVTLISFTATSVGNQQVQVNWVTGSEVDNFGFQLRRSSSNSFAGSALIHEEPTAVPGGTGPGASYSFTDTVPANDTYYYWLVDVETDNDTAVHGPIIVNVTPIINLYLPLVISGN